MCVCAFVCSSGDDGEAVDVFNKHKTAKAPHANCLSIEQLSIPHVTCTRARAHVRTHGRLPEPRLKHAENLCTNNYFLIASNVISCQRNIQMHLRQSSILSAWSHGCDLGENAQERQIIVCVIIIILSLSSAEEKRG